MRLLIVTQAVDQNDPILGFFCRWLVELARHFEHIEVICLKEGKHELPANIRVHSLGKERGVRSKFAYAVRFKFLIWRLRAQYDTVLVHMNPEYILIGGPFWRLWGKHVALWYNHPKNDLRFRLAALLAQKIFYTSPYAAPVNLKKAVQMPVGIDTELFAPRMVPKNRSALYLQGRIMPSKRVHVALEALRLLRARSVSATLTLVGPEDVVYGKKLRSDFSDLIESGAVTFFGPRRNEETPELYSAYGVALNLAAAGHFDKSAFEPMACETPVVLSSQAFKGLVPEEWIVPENDPQALADALAKLLTLSGEAYSALGRAERASVVRNHSLAALGKALVLQLS